MLASLAVSQAVVAQDATGSSESGQPSPLAGREIAFEADGLSYDSEADVVTATGNVLARSGDQSVRADAISWNRMSGEIVATGNVRLVDEDGNQLFTERLELTEELKAGAMQNLLLAFRQGGRLAADAAQRDEVGNIILDQVAYSSCAVETADGCPRDPSWRVTARRVRYDAATDRIHFEGANLELFGARILPLPGLVIRADGSPTSGVLMPDIGLTASNGLEISDSFYWRLADNRDLTVTGYLYSSAAPMVSAQYRQLQEHGAFQISGYGTYSRRIPLNSTLPTAQDEFRGYLFTNGRWQLDPNWSVTGSLRVASDRTFLRRYDISREDRLRSTFNIERIDTESYLSISGWATQALLTQQDQGQVPLALPLIDYRLRLKNPVLGGTVNLQANSLAITRAEGQDTQRAFVRGQWDMRRITGWGQEITLTGLVRGDVYHSDQNELTQTISYRGLTGWQGRGVAVAAVDVKWPLIGSFGSGTQMLTPRVQLVATPGIRNLAIPNEDARSVDLEDSNLFALNRFPGYDRVDDGVRVTYGFDWNAALPGWRLETTIGQSYRMSERASLFPDGTGLDEQWSDFVGRTTMRYRDLLKITHRFRLDKDNLDVRRNEIDATFGNDRNYVEVGYLRLNRDVDLTYEDLQDREELRVAGRIVFARYWSLFGSAVVNLTDRTEDPTQLADGFEPLRTRLGIGYNDDCLDLSVTWRRDYIELADARRGNSFRINFALRNLGFRR
jgi:LPS-assembly protein